MAETVETAVYRMRVEGQSEIDRLKTSLDSLAVSEEKVEASTRTTTQSLQNRLARLDPIIRVQEQYRKALEAQARYEQEGTGTATQRATHLELITQRYNQQVAAINNTTTATRANTQAVGLNRYEILNLSRQLQDVGVSLAGGQSPFVVLTQQGSQILDVFQATNGSVRGFFSQTIGWAGRLIASTAGVVAGIGAIAAGALYAGSSWSDAQRDIEKALIGVGKQSGTTAKDINEIAKSGATAFGLSVDQARGAALELVKTGAIYKTNIKAAVDVTQAFSIVTGKDAKEAAEALGAALVDPVAGADALNKQLGFLDGRTREYIATLVSQNRLQDAQAVLLRNLEAAVVQATNTLGPFEKAWNAVANAANRAKNAIGEAVAGPTTDQDKVSALIARRDQPKTGVGLFNQPGNNRENARIAEELDRVTESMRETARATALTGDQYKKLAVEADNLVRATIPQIQQMKDLETARAKLLAARDNPLINERQGLGAENQNAINAIDVQLAKLRESKDEAARYNEITLSIARSWGNVGISTALALDKLQDQLLVAQQITGQAQIEATYYTTINALLAQGKTLVEATAIAEAQRAVTVAQIDSGIEKQVKGLQQQVDLIEARRKGTEAATKAEQAYTNAIDSGASEQTAGRLQEATYRLEAAQAEDRAAQRRSQLIEQEARANQAAVQMWEQVKAENERLIEMYKYIPFALREAGDSYVAALMDTSKLFDSKQGGKSQFNPAGYVLHNTAMELFAADQVKKLETLYGSGGYDVQPWMGSPWDDPGSLFYNKPPNAQGLTHQTGLFADSAIDSGLKGGGSYSSIIDQLLGQSTGLSSSNPGSMQAMAQTLSRLTNLLPEDQQAGSLQKQIDLLQQQQPTLVRDELIKSLTDSLKQLQEATKENTDALNTQADPLFSQGHDYLNNLRSAQIGFYKAASGFDGIARGGTPGVDSIPFRAMVQEGERVTITPRGGWPKTAVSNDNSKNVTQNITQNISIAEAGPVNRFTARQRAQGFLAAATRAVG